MRASVRLVRVLFGVSLLAPALPCLAQLAPYEWLSQAGRNDVLDSNPSSCDPTEGCYTAKGARCASAPQQLCNLQVVPKGRCSYGSLAANGGPFGSNTCVWPHGAGRCATDTHIGCVTDAYAADPTNTASGLSVMCDGISAFSVGWCDMTKDPFGGPFRTACACDGQNPAAPNFETAVCGGAVSVCSDGDPDRFSGGYGLALGLEVNLGPGSDFFPALGPIVNGSSLPVTSPRYAIENPPVAVEPQRDAGTVGRTPSGAIHPVRTTNARTLADFGGGLGVQVQRSHGDSFWSDWTFERSQTDGLFNTHRAVLACDPPDGWSVDQPVVAGGPGTSDDVYCSAAARDGLAFLWSRDLTADELAAHPACPPNCRKDFDLTTVELEAIQAVADQDANAGVQLALDNAQGRQAGALDAVSVTPLTIEIWLDANDMRCRMGGWGNAPGFVGRCSDGPTACVPGDPTNGDALCSAEGGSCRACNGPIDPANADLGNGQPNALGLPPGYSTHGLADLDLVAGKRIGAIAGLSSAGSLRLLAIGTTGAAAAQFRDLPNEDGSTLDSALLGEVSSSPTPFGVGIGAGGTFQNGAALAIGATCCATGTDVAWPAEAPGTPVGALVRTCDWGAGADGIPGCFGDNDPASNGASACDQRLGFGPTGAKSDGAFNTGRDDVCTPQTVDGVVASPARFPVRHSGPSAAELGYNQVSAIAIRDRSLLGARDVDGLIKLDLSHCPIVNGRATCGFFDPADDLDGDGIENARDNCPTVANGPAETGIASVGNQTDTDADGVGDACDNCRNVANPREAPTCLTTATATCGPWSTLTGGQRDDDHDGYGNKCDGLFPGVTGNLAGAGDMVALRASLGKSRTGDTCGTTGTHPCAAFDLDEVNGVIGAGDLAVFRALNGKPPGPKCPTCPLPCTAGTAGTCGPVP